MTRYVLIRLVQGVIAILLATMIIFWMARITGDPVSAFVSVGSTQKDIDRVRAQMGLDKPLVVQYGIFISQVVRGDFGRSYYSPQQVRDMIFERIPATLKLSAIAILLSLIVAIPMGVFAAVKRDRWPDLLAKIFAMFGQAVPSFWLGIVLILIFGVQLRWLPAGGYGGLSSFVLPAITEAVFSMAGFLRMTRSSMLETLGTDYVRLARIKGVPEKSVVWKHAFRNALIPVVTFTSVFYTLMLTGSVVTETVFAWPGIGRLAYTAVLNRDFPLIQGLVIVFVAMFIIINLFVDVIIVYLDPRVRLVKS
jgi:peptide/nickel transport system permease protein